MFFLKKLFNFGFMAVFLALGWPTQKIHAMNGVNLSSKEKAGAVASVLLECENIKYNLKMYIAAVTYLDATSKKSPFELNEHGQAIVTDLTLEEFATIQRYKSYFLYNKGTDKRIPNIVLQLFRKNNLKMTKLAKFLHIRHETNDITDQMKTIINKVVNQIIVMQLYLNTIPTEKKSNFIEQMRLFLQKACELLLIDTNVLFAQKIDMDNIGYLWPSEGKTKDFLAIYDKEVRLENYYLMLMKKYPSLVNGEQEWPTMKLEAIDKSDFIKPETFEQFTKLHELEYSTEGPVSPRAKKKRKAKKKKTSKSPNGRPIEYDSSSSKNEVTTLSTEATEQMFACHFEESKRLNKKFAVDDSSYIINASDLVIEFGYKGVEGVTDRIICLRNGLVMVSKALAYHERVQEKKRAFAGGERDEDTVLHTFPEFLAGMKSQCLKNTFDDAKSRSIKNWIFFGEKKVNEEMVSGLYVLGFLPRNNASLLPYSKTCYHTFFVRKSFDSLGFCKDADLLTQQEYDQLAEGLDALQSSR